MSAFAVTLLLWATSSSLWKGGESTQSVAGLSALDNPQQLLTKLKEGQSVLLPEGLIVLSETVLVHSSNVEIRGAPGMTTVKCPQRGDAFAVRGTNVTLANLNITGCEEGSGVTVGFEVANPRGQALKYGNAEDEQKLDVRVECCVFAHNSNYEGAAINVKGSRLLVHASFFINNRASRGGAIRARFAKLNITDVRFEANVAELNGGAAQLDDSKATLTNSTFTKNRATAGGALAGARLKAAFRGIKFKENVATGQGGAVALSRSNATLKRSTFTKNNAPDGGALLGDHLKATLRGVQFKKNAATAQGGAVVLLFSNATLTKSRLVKNMAETGGALLGDYLKAKFWYVEFKENIAVDYGGAIYLQNSKATLTGSRLTKNKAKCGGALSVISPEVTLRGVEFEGNTAVEWGGAAYFQDTKAILIDSRLAKNNASDGGGLQGLSLVAKFRNVRFEANVALGDGGAAQLEGSKVTLTNATFANNNAQNGGALMATSLKASFRDVKFEKNVALGCGGAAQLQDSKATVTNSKLENNLARDGGALFCDNCDLDLQELVQFTENVALASGGGMSLRRARNAKVKCALFQRNVAYLGGALKISDCENVTLGDPWKCGLSFEGNVAVEGGAVHMEQGDFQESSYKIRYTRFEENRAVSLENVSSLGDAEIAIESLIEKRKRAGIAHEDEEIDCTDCFSGKGGALFVGLSRQYAGGNMKVFLGKTFFKNNSALLGGACHFDALRSCSSNSFQRWCAVEEHETRLCSFVQYTKLRLRRNHAVLAGGGIFMSSSKNPYSFCKNKMFDASNANKLASSSCFKLRGNRIGSGGYGPDFATEASSLHFKNVYGRLRGIPSGEKLSIYPVSPSDHATGLVAVVRDALDQTITNGVDSRLPVVLISKWIIGASRYRAEGGTISINSTSILGVKITDRIILQSEDQRRLRFELAFSTEPCTNGEIADASNLRCERCPVDLYMFNATIGCRPCEHFAFCNRTTGLVPRQGYWHSTPYSPVVRRCPIKKACSGENRTEKLLDYYSDYSKIHAEMEEIASPRENSSELIFSDYDQCAAGYEGVLCGSCEAGYGHSAYGECEKCDQPLGRTRVSTILVVLAVFGVVSLKLLLEIVGVRKDVEFELIQQRKEDWRVLIEASTSETISVRPTVASHDPGQRREGIQVVVGETVQAPKSSERLSPPNAYAGPFLVASVHNGGTPPAQSSHQAAEIVVDEEPLLSEPEGPDRQRPELTRPDFHIEAPSSDVGDDDVSRDAMEVAGVLSETYNILFNYVQLNSIALCLDIDWKGAVKTLLSLQTIVGRLLKVGAYPLDCGFSDRERDTGLPNSIAVLLLRSAFPWATAGLYAFAIKVWSWTTREVVRKSKYELDIVPPVALIFCCVYFAYCIDLVSDLLSVVDCVHLDPAPEDHPYSLYETPAKGNVWAGDTSLECWKGRHLVLAIFAAVGLAAALAFVVFTVGILYIGKKRRQLRDPKFRLAYGFLFLKYRPDGLALYWGSVITTRRMLFAAISVYCRTRDTTNAEIGLFAIVLIGAIALQEIVKPFDQMDSKATFPSYAGSFLKFFKAPRLARRWVKFNQYVTLNGLEGASLFMSLSLFLTAMSIGDGTAKSYELYILLLSCCFLNALFSLFMIYRIYCVAHRYLDIIARDRLIKFQGEINTMDDRNTWLYIKVWVLFWRNRRKSTTESASLVPAIV